MKILFVCGCLEPGKDGVGDYSRLVGASLIKDSHRVMLLSLHDFYAVSGTKDAEQDAPAKLQVYRISANHSRAKRTGLAKACIAKFDPDWISLQYVPYSFHVKGLDLRLPRFFSYLKGSYKWHIMVHEPWVTSERFFSKGTLTGSIQKEILRLLIRHLGPTIMHTSNSYYQHLLMLTGLRSDLLHLPGNIPVVHGAAELVKEEFMDLGITRENRAHWMLLGMFGRVRADVDYKDVVGKFLKTPEAAGKKIALLSIGNAGPCVDPLFEEIHRENKERVLLYKFGHKEVAEVSGFFQWLDVGIASVPQYLLGKSGAYAAMRNHRLKILVPQIRGNKKSEFEKAAFSCDLEKIPDEDFSAGRVAQLLLLALCTSSPDTKERLNENFVYNP